MHGQPSHGGIMPAGDPLGAAINTEAEQAAIRFYSVLEVALLPEIIHSCADDHA
jgi:hypothetical protein